MSASTSSLPRQPAHDKKPEPRTPSPGFVPTLLDFTYTLFVRPRIEKSVDLVRRRPSKG